MRGLLNVFSLGMDQLASQLARNGIDASVYNHSVAESVVGDIVQKYRSGDHGPYILVGHSLGADAVMMMAQQLDVAGVPVALVVPFDGTESFAALGNVACVLNLTQRKYAYVQAGTGFHGKLSNVDVSSDTSIDHFTIDKSPRLQAMAMSAIMQAVHGQSCRPVGAPIIARPKEPAAPKEAGPKQLTPAKAVAPERSASPARTTLPPNGASPAATDSPSLHSGNEG
jgi:alpha-beta hydrolase superfamily lysophospholipase